MRPVTFCHNIEMTERWKIFIGNFALFASLIVPSQELCLIGTLTGIRCYDGEMKPLTETSPVHLNEPLMIVITMTRDTCQTVNKFLILIIPPSDGNYDKNKGETGQLLMDGHGNYFDIPPYAIAEPGAVTFKMSKFDIIKEIVTGKSFECKFRVAYAKPELLIYGGFDYYYPANKRSSVACQATDLNNKLSTEGTLTFHWKCSVKEGVDSKFCNQEYMEKFNDKNSVAIPVAASQERNVFEITVEARLKKDNSDQYAATFTQVARFIKREETGTLNIQCVKNCRPKSESTVYTASVILKATWSGLDLSRSTYFKWTIDNAFSTKQNAETISPKNSVGEEFYLDPNLLEKNHKYNVKVEVIGGRNNRMSAYFLLDTKLPLDLQCWIEPVKGTAFHTGFRVKCSRTPSDVTYEVFAPVIGKASSETLIKKTSDITEASFMLPRLDHVILNVNYNNLGYTQKIVMNVTVSKCLDIAGKPDNEVTKAVNAKLEDALDFANDGYPDMALQGLGAIVQEYGELHSQELAHSLDLKVIAVLEKIKLDSPETSQQAVDVMSMIVDRYKQSDPEVAVRATELCSKANNVLLNQAKYAKNPELVRNQVLHSLKSVSACSQAGLSQNPQTVETQPASVSIPPLDYPTVAFQGIPEEYRDYADDERSADNMARFELAASNMKQMCFSSAKMMTYTMVPEESAVTVQQAALNITAKRMYCRDVRHYQVIVEGTGITAQPSRECSKHKIPVVDVLMCSTNRNPYWYIDDRLLITPVVYIHFTGSGPRPSTMHIDFYKDPFTLILPSHIPNTYPVKIHKASLPTHSIGHLNEAAFYDALSTHRIFVSKNRGFTIRFENMFDINVYDAIVTFFEKPTYEYFKTRCTRVTRDASVIDVTAIHDFDSFWFLTVLPNRKMVPHPPGKFYEFSVTSTGCDTWNETSKLWEHACNAAAGLTMSSNITCYCKYGLVFTASMVEIRVNLEEDLVLDFELEFKFCWIVFLTTLLSFLAFLVALLLASFEQPENVLDKVFFLADVPNFHQYAYLLLVKTGKQRNAGTTSNVTVQLRGDKSNSLPYVLNYPDPELELLQRDSEICFVLATNKPLGDLKEIELWFDSVGNKVKWFCKRIDVYDIQEEKSWHFCVERWFDVRLAGQNSFLVAPTANKSVQRLGGNKLVRMVKEFLGKVGHESNLWNLRTKDLLLTNFERIGLVCCFVMPMYLCLMLFHAVPEFDKSDTIDANSFGFDWKMAWTPIAANLLVVTLHFPLIFVIKRNKIRTLRAGFPLEAVYRVLAWIGLMILTTLSLTMLVVSGFWVPFDTSLLWLVSVVLSVLFNMAATQNFYRVLYGYLLCAPEQVRNWLETSKRIMQFVELQRVWIYKRFGGLALRPYLRHLYFSLDPITLRERYKWEEVKLKIVEILEDLIMISLYVALLYVVLAFERDEHAIYNHDEVENLVSAKSLNSIDSVSSIEMFISDLLPLIQSTQWYGKFVQNNPGMTKDFANKYLGIIRLRQHRTMQVSCSLPHPMDRLSVSCRPHFQQLPETRSFSRGWGPSTSLSNVTTERMSNVWRYTSSSGASSYFGQHAVYPGGGYVAPLGRNLKNSLINLEYLRRHRWLDLRTRAVFVEFLIYNPNVNLFNAVTLLFECDATGHITSEVNVRTSKLLMVDQNELFTRNVISVFFLVIVGLLVVRSILKLVKKKRQYFYDFWSLMDVVIVTLSALSLYLYYIRLWRIHSYIEAVAQAKNNEFVDYFHLFSADSTLTMLTATLVFVATLRLWKLLRFLVIVKIAEMTVKDAGLSLVLCLSYQLMFVVAFSVAGMLLFGENSQDFSDWSNSLIILVLLSLNLQGEFNLEDLNSHPLGVTFYIVYMLVSFFFINIYIAIISLHYADSKDFYADEQSSVLKFLGEKWIYYKTLCSVRKKKLRGGAGEEFVIIKPKPGERYEGCFTIPKRRLDAMALVTRCVLRNLENQRAIDFELMSKTIKALYGNEDGYKEKFFPIGDSRRITFVDDRKITQIAQFCELLAQFCMAEGRVSRKTQQPLIEERIGRLNMLIDNIETMKDVLNNIEIR